MEYHSQNMKHLIFSILFLSSFSGFSQSIREMKPVLGNLISKSSEGEIEFLKQSALCKEIWKKQSNEQGNHNLTPAEQVIFDKCQDDYESYWDVIGVGCSWYCGGGVDTISASSELKPTKDISFSAGNIHDLSYKTAWIEGVPGFGIGEWIMYHFPPESPRITEIIVVNGYVKSEKAWRENSRVKKLKMYIDNKPFAILYLEDSMEEQHFKFEPLGYKDRSNFKKLESMPWWTIKFEILEVYEGEKYDDTAISEIYFDGIDVH